MSRYHTHEEKEMMRDRNCEACIKDYDTESSPCSRCGSNVTNGAFFKKTSPHFKGTCRPAKFFPDTIPEQSWKCAVPYPMPAMPSYKGDTWPTSLEDLCKFWGVPAVGDRMPILHNGCSCTELTKPCMESAVYMEPAAYDELAGKVRMVALLAEQNALLKQLVG